MDTSQCKRLHSHIWSSETLLDGMREIGSQPHAFLVKDECDEALVQEYHVSCPLLGNLYLIILEFFSSVGGVLTFTTCG